MIGIVVILAFLFLVGLIGEKVSESIKNDLLKQKFNQNQFCETETIEIPFSTTEYFDRIEKAYNEILEQKERQSSSEEYVIILWWGLDGLRLNKDGSSKWISKRKEEPVVFIPTYPQYNAFAINPLINPLNYQLQQCCCTMDYINSLQAQCMQSTHGRILELQERNQQLQFQIAQSEQNRRIVESVQGGKGNQQIINIGFTYQ